MMLTVFNTILLLCASEYINEDAKWSNLIIHAANQSLFEVTGYPLTGDIPLLNRKIFRGTRVSIREHPYIASIRRNNGHYLTATLITRNIVLTVAHPVMGVPIQELKVVVGESYSDRGTMLLTVILIVIHEDFDPYTLVGDLAMIRFYEDVIFRSSVKSISVVMSQLPLQENTGFVSGWGRCDFTGKELCLPRTSKYFPDEKIDPMLRTVPLKFTLSNFYCEGYKRHETKVETGMLCIGAGREENPASPCLAVPGAPLVVKAQLAGILSWGFGCGYLHDLPLVYTNTQHYLTWIAHNIVIFGNLSKDDFTSLFQATKSYLIMDWLSKTRVSKPLEHSHGKTYKELQLMTLDQELAKLQGQQYDIRDFIYEKKFYPRKKLLYEEIKRSQIQNNSTAKNNNSRKNVLLLLKKATPFLSNKTLLDISIDDEDYNISDED